MTDHNHTHASSQQDDSSDEHCHQTTFDPETDAVSKELIDAVATVNDADPDELAVLANFIDPDALDTLFQPRLNGTSRNSNTQVQFKYDEYTIKIQTDGTITLHQPNSSAED